MEAICTHCLGTGIDPVTQETCHVCGGTGRITPEGVHEEIHAYVVDSNVKINDMADKVNDIKQKVDETKTVVDEIKVLVTP